MNTPLLNADQADMVNMLSRGTVLREVMSREQLHDFCEENL